MPVAAQSFLAGRISRWPPAWRVIATATSLADNESPPPALDARLFHWLSTLVIDLPPLAARIEDLPLLVQYFVEECNAGGTRQVSGFAPAAVDQMQLYDWSGGLEQLREAVSAAHSAARGPVIGPSALPPYVRRALAAAAFPPDQIDPIRLEQLLANLETTLIRRALELADGNKTQAAALVGMTRPRLYRRMQQLGLE